MEIRKRYFLSKKDVKKIKNELNEFFEDVDEIIPKKSNVEIAITDDFEIILVDKEPVAFKKEDKIIPTLKLLLKKLPNRNLVVVDMGAIKFLINGADVMAPGIVDADENINEGDVVFVVDENHKKPICIGIALMDGKEMKEADKGKAIKNLHYVGDKIWNFKG
ncbi:RNA-binding protein [Methanocaldococcus fervens]|uniref:PUA domain containing protein n=1 Tax=Methanocaldococcus fervens (strain DSM 4213 / JCM 15782 / AG86) TaxID=573064 RepID=C7P9G5_METFA|nr:RNA-binding protein [Methanocaldococcus fervens]ACV25197.1 PUA domain containing protein [Methanocaldococcus fervens AG86]